MSEMNASELPAVSAEDIDRFFEGMFGKKLGLPETRLVARDRVVVRLECQTKHLRPGGYISGPTQMGLADHVAYLAVFTRAGITPMALTSNLNINFLRPCKGTWLEADGRILKFGRSGVVVEVALKGSDNDKTASHAVVTYVLPKDET